MRKIIALSVVCIALAGCSSLSITVPVTGQVGKGVPATGQAVAGFDGHGEFWVQVANGGPRCTGTYNSLDPTQTITMPVACSDGRSGQLITTRRDDQVSGYAVAKLTDGTTGRFVFGGMKYEQAFGERGEVIWK